MTTLLHFLVLFHFFHLSISNLNYTSIRFRVVGQDMKTHDLTDASQPTRRFEENSEIILLVLAWNQGINTPWIINITKAYHNRNDKKYQIIYVDWSYEGNAWYYHDVKNVDAIGYFAGDWLIQFAKMEEIDIDRFHVLSHSLGCHITGFMAKYIKEQLGRRLFRITCLDGAGPGFFNIGPEKRLYRGDAKILVAIHTDSGNLGLAEPYADVDFYPNGGLHGQPGCNISDISALDSCSHCRSHGYWVEGIISNMFYGTECDSWDNYQDGFCENNRKLNFAGDMTSIKELDSGLYFTTTNAEEPFLGDSNLIADYYTSEIFVEI